MTGPCTTAAVTEGIDLTGRTCLVTGAAAGLGRETARALAAAGAHVVLTGRSAERLAVSERELREALPGAELSTVALDLASLSGVRAAAAEIRERWDRLDVLVANAGVMFTPYGRTVDGFETQIGTNHLGHFLLVRLLEPLLLRAAPARVVVLSSAGHKLGDVDLDDLGWERRDYDKFAAYGASKTANILFAVELDRRFRHAGVRALAVHPGTVRTELARHMGEADFAEMKRRAAANADPANPRPLRAVDVDQGAATTVWAATAPELAGRGGLYLTDCAVSDDVRAYAVDPDRAVRLWEISEHLVGRS